MTTHNLSLTYAPKIPLVKSGECTQTIRLHNPDRPKKVGDKLILHTWEGKPYRSKWDWRLETEISELILLDWGQTINEAKLSFTQGKNWVPTDELGLKNIAISDGIEHPHWMNLMEVLQKLNNKGSIRGTIWDVIRWPKPTIRRVE